MISDKPTSCPQPRYKGIHILQYSCSAVAEYIYKLNYATEFTHLLGFPIHYYNTEQDVI